MSIAIRRRWVRRNRLNAAECLESRLLLAGAPIINEFVASNTTGLLDEDGDASDWFEVYNPTTEVIDLKGWYATDDSDRLRHRRTL